MRKAERLRELFSKDGIIRLVGAHDGLSAKIVEECGFDGVWASGLEISTSYAVPDANILTMSQYLERACEMNDAAGIPVVADCDTGFGNSNNVIHMVRKYEAAGIAAVCIEDKHFPKLNSFVSGRQELASISEFVGKILAAKNAQASSDFMLIARVEALIAGWGMEEALKRANAYVDAGADAVLIHSKIKTPAEIYEFAAKWANRAPLVVVPTTYYSIGINDLENCGIKAVIYANHGIRASIKAIKEALGRIYLSGSSAIVESNISTMKEVFELQGMAKMKADEMAFSKNLEDSVKAVIPAAGGHLNEYSMKDIFSDIPVSMLDINGKPLLQRQIETLNRCKVDNIYCVTGYKREAMDLSGFSLVQNEGYKNSGILASVMCALNQLAGMVLVIYGDILFDHVIINRLLESSEDITVIADATYDSKHYGPERKIELIVQDGVLQKSRRSLHKTALGIVKKIGLQVDPNEGHYEFPGILMLSKKGTQIFKEAYEESAKKYNGLRFGSAEVFQKAGVSDLLQEIIDSGQKVSCLEVNSGWLEINSLADYKLACSIIK